MDLDLSSVRQNVNDENSSSGPIYLSEEDGKECLQKLHFLNSYHVFVIQRKTTVDYFSSNVTHEVMDHRKNHVLKATQSKSFFKKKKIKLSLRTLRNDKVIWVTVEPTNNLTSTGTEATVYIGSSIRVAHVEKYGGSYSLPCYEVFNSDLKTAFTVDPAPKKSPNSNPAMLDFDVCTKKGILGTISMKTGLNYILNTDISATPIEKVTLISVILAMDLLKTEGRDKKKQAGNDYLFH